MKDEQEREPGIYVETTTKESENVIYTLIETTNIGKNRDIIKYQREYNPGILFPIEWKDI